MEGRMTVCNMSIEAGARAGLIAPDETTFEYLKGRMHAPKGAAWDEAIAAWKQLRTDDGATWDKEVTIDATKLTPFVSWGTNPAQVLPIDASVPSPSDAPDAQTADTISRALEYMGLQAGTKIRDIAVDTVFIGSCTNSRIEDLRMVADFVKGKRKADDVEVWIVPGSKQVEKQAIEEGIDKVFEEAGFMLRQPGCSACLGMNEDKIPQGKYCISTSNRNFEGRQGVGARTLLASPLSAAAAAVTGVVTDIRKWMN